MIRTNRLRIVARIAAVALLFTQAVVAFADCRMPARDVAAAIAAEDAPCHESPGETNVCVAHCLAGDQSLDKPLAAILGPSVAAVLVLQPMADVQAIDASALRRFVPPAAAPPPRILFRTLRI